VLPGAIKILSMEVGEDSVVIRRLQIGSCFMCSSMPRYPRYFHGTWRLFFSSGEEVAITVYSDDLRGSDPLRAITRSKDTLQLYNNPALSGTDQIRFVSYNKNATHMDSAVITFDEFDTTGLGATGLDKLTAQWRERSTPVGMTYFNLQKIDAKKYRMVQRPSAASNPVPLGFDVPGETLYITQMEIGTCLDCSGLPAWYPPHVKGTMELHFTSGQIIRIRLITDYSSAAAGEVAQRAAELQIGKVLNNGNMLTVASGTGIALRTVRLFDAAGRQVARTMPGPHADHTFATISTASLPGGIYYLMVSASGRTETRRVVLQR
jgi:hypothetical protein